MPAFQDLPVQSKLRRVIMLTCIAALLLACGAFMVSEVVTYRRAFKSDMSTLGVVVANNCGAALAFDDSRAAGEKLLALASHRQILVAGLYADDGTLFAQYVPEHDHRSLPEKPGPDGVHFTGGQLQQFQPVMFKGKRVGTIYLLSDLADLHERLQLYGLIVVIVLAVSILLALGLSFRLERLVSRPILALAETARQVSERSDYSVRAQKHSADEVGLLTDAFNQMLTQIQERDAALLSARDELEQRVEERTEDLARSNKELELFAYIASHDLQEPLRAVAGFMELLRQRYHGKLDDRADQYMTFAVDGAKRMQALINGLLEYSRVSTRGKPFGPVDCEVLLQQVLANLNVAVTESGAVVTHDPLPTVLGDDAQLTRLFQNLIANAIKFHGDKPPRIHIGATPNPNAWEFAISDNGIGVESQYFKRIFVIFQRLHTQKEYPGTGLGLAICQKIVERHAGRIWVESTPGQGTTFRFTIAEKEGAKV